MIYRCFFWDFDGTLYDSYDCINAAALAALAEKGIRVQQDELISLTKRSLKSAFLRAAPAVDLNGLMAEYRRHAHAMGVEKIRLYPGAKDMLRAVCESGGRNYLYTHRHTASAMACMERDGITALFTDAVTADDGFPAKPAPDALRHLLRKHALDAKDCVMVGDRSIDLDAGKNAGMAACLFDPEGFYPDYPADWRFQDFSRMRKTLL